MKTLKLTIKKQLNLCIVSISLRWYRIMYWLKNGVKATHIFFYSKNQDNIKLSFDYDPFFSKMPEVSFNGKKYSEMREFKHGNQSNWDDAIIVGVGTIADVVNEY